MIRNQTYHCICKQGKTVLNRLNLNFDYLENPMNYNSQVTLQLTLSLRNTSRILNPSAFNNDWNICPKPYCDKGMSNLYIIVIKTKLIKVCTNKTILFMLLLWEHSNSIYCDMPQFHPSMILFKNLVIKQKPLPILKENFNQTWLSFLSCILYSDFFKNFKLQNYNITQIPMHLVNKWIAGILQF